MTRTDKMKVLSEVQEKLAYLVSFGSDVPLPVFDREVRELREKLYFVQDAVE